MARIMALDYGTKRIGVAITDELQLIASGLTTVNTNDIMVFLENFFNGESVETVVIGKPMQMNYKESESEPYIREFIQQLEKKFPQLKIERVDERFTSKLAFQSMIDSGLKKKKRRDKSMIDEISATLILQNYLELNS